MECHKNHPDDFPNLRLSALQLYARRWVNKYSTVPLKRVLLYRYSPLFPSITKGVPVKYAIVFELATVNKAEMEAYMEFEWATEYYQTVREEYPFSEFIDAGFSDVYHQLPDGDFRDDWLFIPKVTDDESLHKPGEKPKDSIRLEEPYWILYQLEPISPEDSKVMELINAVRAEIESLYDAVKKMGFSGRDVSATEQQWQTAALTHFDDNEAEFKFIKRKYLEDRKIYYFTGGKERRDFIGRLLKTTMQDYGLGVLGARRLYQLYRSTDQPTISPTNL